MQVSQSYTRKATELTDLPNLFYAVIESVQRIRELPLVTASQIDDELPRQRLLNASAVNYLADVEAATKAALSKGGVLSEDLWNSFVALFAGERVAPSLRGKVIYPCAKFYKSRGLHPNSYFKLYRRESASSLGRCA
jgi:hypothetical protein